jgi:hypothetical protein
MLGIFLCGGNLSKNFIRRISNDSQFDPELTQLCAWSMCDLLVVWDDCEHG